MGSTLSDMIAQTNSIPDNSDKHIILNALNKLLISNLTNLCLFKKSEITRNDILSCQIICQCAFKINLVF